MFPTQISTTNSDEFSRCEERSQMLDHGKSLRKIPKTDMAIKGDVGRAIWNDDVLRADVDWAPPYCPDDVLFPVEKQEVGYQILEQLPRPPLIIALNEQLLREQLLASESLGG